MQRIAGALAIAMAIVFGSPAAAQSLTVYGRLYPEVIWTRMTGSTQPGTPVSTIAAAPNGETFSSIFKMDSSNSRLGFRGD